MANSPASPLNLLSVTASDLQASLDDGTFTSVPIVTEYYKHISMYNDKLRAIISMPPNLIEITQGLDNESKAGKVRGPLHGIPIMVKVCASE